MKKIALVIFISLLLVDLFGIVFVFTQSDYDGGIIGGFLLIGLFFVSMYFGLLTIWAYNLYQKEDSNKTETFFHLITILILGFIIPIYIIVLGLIKSKDIPAIPTPDSKSFEISSKTEQQILTRKLIKGTWYLNKWITYHTLIFNDSTVFVDNNVDTVFRLNYSVTRDTLITWTGNFNQVLKNKIMSISSDTLVLDGMREVAVKRIYTRTKNK